MIGVNMNRRHTAILFVSLVLTGSALLAGAELKEALGMMMLGVALAWAVGSDVASKSYSRLKGITSTFYLWIRLPLVMILAGCILGAVLLLSHANPLAAIAVMSAVGVIVAPFTLLPTQLPSLDTSRGWLRIPLLLLATAAFFLAALGSLAGVAMFDRFEAEQNAERLGQLMVPSFVALLVGIWWLSKGWKLIQRGINVEAAPEPAPVEGSRRRMFGQYVWLFLGVLTLTLWLGLLAWSASSNWAYAPQAVIQSKPNENLLTQAGFILLLAWLPYSIWKKLLDREPNSDGKNVRRHRRITAAAGMIFSVVLCFAVTFGIQNGNDRIFVNQIDKSAAELKEVGGKIGSLKQRDLKTTADYITAYSEIEPLRLDFDSKIQHCAAIYREARQRDESRGPINIQRFYKSNTPEVWQNYFDMLELLRQVSALTRRETLTVSNMAALPERDQVQFWQAEFRPLLEQEDALREKILALQTKMQPAMNTK